MTKTIRIDSHGYKTKKNWLRQTTKKRDVSQLSIPAGKKNWRERREVLLEHYVRPLIPTSSEKSAKQCQKRVKAELSLRMHGLFSVVESDIMSHMTQLLDAESFPDYIAADEALPHWRIRHIKNQIRFFLSSMDIIVSIAINSFAYRGNDFITWFVLKSRSM